MTWDPSRYHRFGDLRLRPGLDLINRITGSPRLVYDLGCGTGELTNILGHRFPEAQIVGIDNSEEMLDRAQTGANVEFRIGSIEDFAPESPPDLIFSNAALHWLPDHDRLFPQLLKLLTDTGQLAVQMPDNWRAPTHTLINEVMAEQGLTADMPTVATPEEYLAWLGKAQTVDVWRTTYFQVLSGQDSVISWVEGSILGPVRGSSGPAELPAGASRPRRSLSNRLSPTIERGHPSPLQPVVSARRPLGTFDRHPDGVAVLGPRSVVVPHLVKAEQVS